MQFTIVHERPEEGPRSGPVQVGWLFTENRSSVIYEPPERLRSVDTDSRHAKSASRCPAVINLESRYFAVKCPFDIHIRLGRDKEGKPAIRNMLGEKSPVRPSKLANLIAMTSEREWRYADRPTLQLKLPYLFVADEPVYMQQVAPFLHYRREPWPGTIFGGRFPIDVWPRGLTWAFEWHDIERDLVLKRGEPLFYLCFETEPQDRPVQLVEIERTEDLDAYLEMIEAAVNYVNQTFSLFKTARERRPETLITPKKR